MLRRTLLLKSSLVILAVSMLTGAPVVIHAASGSTGGATASTAAAINAWRPVQPAAGMGSIVWTNFNGNGAQLNIDLERGNLVSVRENKQNTHQFIVDSQNSYTISTAMNDIPGRMQINVAPGTYNYTASVPGVGTVNGTFELKAGQVMGLSFYGGEPKTIVENHSHHNNDHTVSTTIFTELLVAQGDLTAQAR